MTGFTLAEQETIIRIPKKGDEFYIYTNRPEHYRLVQRKAGNHISNLRVEVDSGREISWDFSLPLTFLSKGNLGLRSEKQAHQAKEMSGKRVGQVPVLQGV